MNCHICQISGICKMYQMVQEQKAIAEIHINNCIHFKGKNGAMPIRESASSVEPQDTLQSAIKRTRPVEEISSVADKIKELYKENSSSSEPKAPDLKVVNFCIDCEENETLNTCSSCGSPVCDSCATISLGNNSRYCSKCWNE